VRNRDNGTRPVSSTGARMITAILVGLLALLLALLLAALLDL